MVLNFQQKNLDGIILPQPSEKKKKKQKNRRVHVLDMMTVHLSVVKYDVSVYCFMAAIRLFAAVFSVKVAH